LLLTDAAQSDTDDNCSRVRQKELLHLQQQRGRKSYYTYNSRVKERGRKSYYTHNSREAERATTLTTAERQKELLHL
jgi:hypothetical protein